MSEKYSFKVLRKKIEKVDAMLKELDPSDEKHRKMGKKREQYMQQLRETPEWETEGALIEKRERLLRETKRLRQAADQGRHKIEENSGAREEARRMMREKRETEEARRKAEKEAKLKAEEEARKAKEARFREREERERREKQESERRAIEEQERREREKREKQEKERHEKQERERRAREEQERREREEAERLAKEEQERLEREQAEQAAKEEKERHGREQAEQAAKEGQQRREREEAERLAKEEQERLEREQAEQAAKEDQERIEHEDAERLAKEEQEKPEREKVESVVEEKPVPAPVAPVEEQAKIQQNNEERLEAEEDAPEVAIEAGEYPIGDEEKTVEEQIIMEEIVEAEGDDIEVDAQDESNGPVAIEMVDTPEATDDEAPVKDDDNLEQPGKSVEEVGVDNIQVEDEQEQESAKEAPRAPMTGMGGLFAEIGLKKKEMDATREPVEEKTPRTLAPTVETKQTDSESPATALDKPEVRVTSRATGKEVLSKEFLAARQSVLSLPRSENTKKILQELSATEGYHKKLEKHLNQNGIPIPADIPYEVCKDKLASITEKMRNLQTTEQDPYMLEKKYFELEKQMAKYSTAMMLTDQWAEEQRRLAEEWEEAVKVDNLIAIKQVRSHMPVNVRSMTEVALTTEPSPSGKILPKQFAKKFKRTNVLQLLRVNPEDIEKMHPNYFEGMRTTGLTLTERRALYEHMKGIGARWEAMKVDKNVERKWMWHDALKAKFKELRTAYDKHVTEYGPPDDHPVAKRNDPEGGGCPLLGNQCPVKADRVLDYSEDYGYTMEAEYESSGSQKSSESKSVAPNQKAEAHDLSKKKVDDEEIMALLRERLNLKDAESEADKKFLRELLHAEKRTRLLEKSLAQAGIEVPEDDIPYAEAKAKAEELTGQIKVIAGKMGSTSDMKEMALLEKEYVTLSSELDKYNNAMMLTKEWAAEEMEKERTWEERVRPENQNALRMIRRHMPVNIRDMSEESLIKETTPNSKKLPQKIARKFKRTNILLLLRMDPSAIEPMHPSSLESMRTTGLALPERRALHEHLKDLGTRWKASSKDKMAERKWMWHESLRSKFRELVDKYDEHVEKYGPPENHPYAKRGDPTGGGCPLLGNQCPVKADLAVDYSDDYGFPEDAEYRTDSVAKSNLVTMEDIKKRREEEEAEFEEEAPKKAGGFLAAIGFRKN
jgi:hypothetical protein